VLETVWVSGIVQIAICPGIVTDGIAQILRSTYIRAAGSSDAVVLQDAIFQRQFPPFTPSVFPVTMV